VSAAEYRIGCASWLDATLLSEGAFYPRPSMTAEARLRWYARFFDTVEVNATYYAIPAARTVENWVDRTPDDFDFSVKAHAMMTGHHFKPERLPPAVRAVLPRRIATTKHGDADRKQVTREALDACFAAFRDTMRPLADAGKLGYVLFQLAPWIGYAPKTLDYLTSIPERLPGWHAAVEFRNSSWIPKHTDDTLRVLRDTGLAFVAIDAPWQPLVAEATTDWAVMRFHGRNTEGWEAQMRGDRPTVAEKYDYLYSPQEVAALTAKARQFDGKVGRVYATFNNNRADYPIRNALAMRALLGQEAPDPEVLKAEYGQRASRAARR
jgi:uncharacterized protein YecE (DUF72 family)